MNDFLQVTQALFGGAWSMLVTINFPGTELSVAYILVGAFMAGVSLRVIKYLLNYRSSHLSDIPKRPWEK